MSHRFSNSKRVRESLLAQAGYPFRYQSWKDVPQPLRVNILENVSEAIERIREAQ